MSNLISPQHSTRTVKPGHHHFGAVATIVIHEPGKKEQRDSALTSTNKLYSRCID